MSVSPRNVQVFDGDGIDPDAARGDRRCFPGLYRFSVPVEDIIVETGISEVTSSIIIPMKEDNDTLDLFQGRIIEVGGPLRIERLEVMCYRNTYYFADVTLVDIFWNSSEPRWFLHGTWARHGVYSAW